MEKTSLVVSWEQVPVIVDLPYVAVILGANPEVVRRYLATGKIRGFKVGREWRITKDELINFVSRKENPCTTQ